MTFVPLHAFGGGVPFCKRATFDIVPRRLVLLGGSNTGLTSTISTLFVEVEKLKCALQPLCTGFSCFSLSASCDSVQNRECFTCRVLQFKKVNGERVMGVGASKDLVVVLLPVSRRRCPPVPQGWFAIVFCFSTGPGATKRVLYDTSSPRARTHRHPNCTPSYLAPISAHDCVAMLFSMQQRMPRLVFTCDGDDVDDNGLDVDEAAHMADVDVALTMKMAPGEDQVGEETGRVVVSALGTPDVFC